MHRRTFKGQDVDGVIRSNSGMVLVLDIHKIHLINLCGVDQAPKKLANKSECPGLP